MAPGQNDPQLHHKEMVHGPRPPQFTVVTAFENSQNRENLATSTKVIGAAMAAAAATTATIISHYSRLLSNVTTFYSQRLLSMGGHKI